MKLEIEREQIEALTKLNCDHVIFGDESQHCDKNDNDAKRGACCNSCWTRRWAEGVLANASGQIPPASGGNLDRLVGRSESDR